MYTYISSRETDSRAACQRNYPPYTATYDRLFYSAFSSDQTNKLTLLSGHQSLHVSALFRAIT